MSKHQDLPVILHNEKRGLITIEDDTLEVLELSSDGRPPRKLVSSALRNLLRVKLADAPKPGERRRLDLHTLIAKGRHLRLTKLHVLVEPINSSEAESWLQAAMQAAYGNFWNVQGTKPFRRILLLVNPIGGKGKARAIAKSSIIPILEAAGCVVDTRETTHRYHAEEIAQQIPLDYDVIATVSGDGLVHEVFNGLAARPDATKALKIPIASIPTGSANSLFLNLYGIKDTYNVELATLTAIKGRPMPVDLCSVLLLPSMKRRWAFFSVCIGLFVDLDIGTEPLRWMGDTRFFLGFLKGVMQNRTHRCRVKLKVEEDDKIHMARKARERVADILEKKVIGGGTDPLGQSKPLRKGQNAVASGSSTPVPESTSVENGDGLVSVANGKIEESGTADGRVLNGDVDTTSSGPLPQAELLQPDDTWRVIESGGKSSSTSRSKVKAQTNPNQWPDGEGLMFASLGTMPYLDRDIMQWPVAWPGSGMVDVVVQPNIPRTTMLSKIAGAENGDLYHMQQQYLYKVSAMVCENLDKTRQPMFTIDGEAFPYDAFHVEVHKQLGNILSLDGHIYISDFLKRQGS